MSTPVFPPTHGTPVINNANTPTAATTAAGEDERDSKRLRFEPPTAASAQQQQQAQQPAATSRWARFNHSNNNSTNTNNNNATAYGMGTPLVAGGGSGGGGGLGLGLGGVNAIGTPAITGESWRAAAGAGGGGLGASTPLVSGGGGAAGQGLGLGLNAGGGTPLVSGMMMAGGGGLGLGGGATPLVSGSGLMSGLGLGLGGATPTLAALGLGMGSGIGGGLGMQTPNVGAGLGLATPSLGIGIGLGGMTPSLSGGGATIPLVFTPASAAAAAGGAAAPISRQTIATKAEQLEKEYDQRNRYLTDEDLDDLMPALNNVTANGGSGYSIVPVPASYVPIEPERPNFFELAARALESSANSGGAAAAAGPSAPHTVYEVPEEMGNGLPNLTPDDVASGAFDILLKYHNVPDAGIPAADVPTYVVMQQLLMIKNGDTKQKRFGTRALVERADLVGLDLVFTCLFDRVYMRCETNAPEKHAIVKVVERLIVRYRDRIAPYVRRVISAFESLLTHQDAVMRDDGKDVIAVLASTVGISHMYEGIKRDIDSEDDRVRRHTAKVIAIIAVALGPEEVMRIVRPVSKAKSPTARHTITKAIEEMIDRLGYGVARVSGDLGLVFAGDNVMLRDSDVRVKTDAAIAFSKLCEVLTHNVIVMSANANSKVASSTGSGPLSATSGKASDAASSSSIQGHDVMASDTYKLILQIVREQCRQVTGRRKLLSSFLRALGSMIPLMNTVDSKRQAEEILPYLISHFNSPDDELRRIVLRVVRQCLIPVGVSSEYLRQYLLKPFFDNFWILKTSTEDRHTKLLLVSTTTEVARKCGGAEVLNYLIPLMVADTHHHDAHLFQDRYPPLQELVLDAAREVLAACGTLDLSNGLIERLIERGLEAFRRDTDGGCRAALRAFAAIVNGCGHVIGDYHHIIVPEIILRLEVPGNENEGVRSQAAHVLSMIAETLYRNGEGIHEVRRITNALNDRIVNEDRAPALAAALRAMVTIGKLIGCERLDPPPADLIEVLQPIIKNRDPLVQQYAVELIDLIAMMYNRYSRVPPQQCDPVAVMTPKQHDAFLTMATNDLFPLLACHRKPTRRACIRAFATLALVSNGFLKVATGLIGNLAQDTREIRILTATALASLAERCKPFTVIPFLIFEYQLCQGTDMAQTIQHSILKAIRFILEEVGPELGKDYLFSLVPLIDRAATEQSLQMRRMAMELIRAALLVMVDAPVGGPARANFANLAIHFLNLAHPNIVELLSGKKQKISEERLKLISSTVQIYEVARLIVGSSVIYQYLANGLFHPAEKVRDIYWRTYNLVYIANPEALLPSYPPLELVIVSTTPVQNTGADGGDANETDNANDGGNKNKKKAEAQEIVEFGRLSYKRHELYTI